MLHFAFGLQPEQVRVSGKGLVVLMDVSSFIRRGFLPWCLDQRQTVISCFSVRNCGRVDG